MEQKKENSKAQAADQESRFQAFNPATGENIPGWYRISSPDEVNSAIVSADRAFHNYRNVSASRRADFLEKIADEILSLGDDLIKRCVAETALPEARIISERGRTINQLKLFAGLVREGTWVNARIDTAIPDRTPLPKPDVRQMHMAIGPVGVFEAGNFPLAFSTAGGDTASALAAGCTVVAKSHSGHPGTSALVAEAIRNAMKLTGMPEGTFALLHGPGEIIGTAIVNHPLIKAIGFTGSFSGGKALYDAAVRRKEPIPVYAEMGSVNPVFVLPDALKTRKEEIAAMLVDSVVLGTGQFCTNPGLIVMEGSADATAFRSKAGERLSGKPASAMLSPRIKKSFDKGLNKQLQTTGVQQIAQGKPGTGSFEGVPHLLETTLETFLSSKELWEEVFGPSSLLIVAKSKDEVLQMARQLEGQLTVTIHATTKDLLEYGELVTVLTTKAGRLIMNSAPTGVEVCHSMVHGGPFPATSDARSTSVGTLAIYRFVRPVCFQDFAQDLLPLELRNSNQLSITRLVNGILTKDNI